MKYFYFKLEVKELSTMTETNETDRIVELIRARRAVLEAERAAEQARINETKSENFKQVLGMFGKHLDALDPALRALVTLDCEPDVALIQTKLEIRVVYRGALIEYRFWQGNAASRFQLERKPSGPYYIEPDNWQADILDQLVWTDEIRINDAPVPAWLQDEPTGCADCGAEGWHVCSAAAPAPWAAEDKDAPFLSLPYLQYADVDYEEELEATEEGEHSLFAPYLASPYMQVAGYDDEGDGDEDEEPETPVCQTCGGDGFVLRMVEPHALPCESCSGSRMSKPKPRPFDGPRPQWLTQALLEHRYTGGRKDVPCRSCDGTGFTKGERLVSFDDCDTLMLEPVEVPCTICLTAGFVTLVEACEVGQ
jgi:hypothetical protein